MRGKRGIGAQGPGRGRTARARADLEAQIEELQREVLPRVPAQSRADRWLGSSVGRREMWLAWAYAMSRLAGKVRHYRSPVLRQQQPISAVRGELTGL